MLLSIYSIEAHTETYSGFIIETAWAIGLKYRHDIKLSRVNKKESLT